MCELALDLAGDPALGLRWAERVMERGFGPLAHMLAYTENLRQGFELLSQFQSLICDETPHLLVERADAFAVRKVGWPGSSPRTRWFAAEVTTAGFLTLVRVFSVSARPRRVSFAYEAPPHTLEYTRAFGPVVQFEQPFTEIEFDRELLDARSPHSDSELYLAQKRIVEQRLWQATQHAPYAWRVRELLLERSPKRIPMPKAASYLGVSERTLRAQLAAEGTSYREIECAALGMAARQLLEDPRRTIQETAFAMGFADATTFHRAFKRWTGTTPSALRRQPRSTQRMTAPDARPAAGLRDDKQRARR